MIWQKVVLSPEAERKLDIWNKMKDVQDNIREIEKVNQGLGLPQNVVDIAQGIALSKCVGGADKRGIS